MNLTLHIPDELAARLQAAGGDIERQALDALSRTADELERGRLAATTARDAGTTGAALIAAMQASPARDIDLTAGGTDRTSAREAATRIIERRKSMRLGGLTIKELIDDGRP